LKREQENVLKRINEERGIRPEPKQEKGRGEQYNSQFNYMNYGDEVERNPNDVSYYDADGNIQQRKIHPSGLNIPNGGMGNPTGMPGGFGPGAAGGMNMGKHSMPGPISVQQPGYKGSSVAYNQNTTNNSRFSLFGNSGLFEILISISTIVFLYNCIFGGRNDGDKLATIWYNANHLYYEERFEEVGTKENIDSTNATKNESPMVKVESNVYKYYASNFNQINLSIVTLETSGGGRNIFNFFGALLTTDYESISYHVFYEQAEEYKTVFAMIKKKAVKALRKSCIDVNFFCKEYDFSIMSDDMTLIAEEQEIIAEIFSDKDVLAYYKNAEPYLNCIYSSDQKTYSPEYFHIFKP
jgi:hypothetical protein